jgi:hypothetical protein
VFSEVVVSHPSVVGVLAWPWGRATVIVKVTSKVGLDGNFAEVPLESREPLRLDTFDEAGHLLHATDFAPYKPACDVIFVGRDATLRPAHVVARVAGRELHLEPGAPLGPRESILDGGDPTRSPELWSGADADFSRFHSARPSHRMACPAGDFDVDVRLDDARLVGRFVGPSPRATVTSIDGGRVFARAQLALDTIGLAVRPGMLVTTFRGLLDHRVPAEDARLVIELCDRYGIVAAEPRWSVVSPVVPSSAARGVAPSGGAAVAPPDRTVAAPEGTAEISPAIGRSRATTLPFERGGAPSKPKPPPSADFAALRAATSEVVPAWGSDEGTLLVVPRGASPIAKSAPAAIPAPVRPIAPHPGSTPTPVAPTAVAPTPVVPTPAARLSAPPLQPAPTPPPAGAERVAAIQREIWNGDRTLQDILREHGLSELEWRALRREARRRR